MSEIFTPVLFAAFFWWISTGIILRLVRLRPSTFKWTAGVATALMALSMAAVVALRGETAPWAAYAGFVAGALVWAWHEVLFLLGFVSGSRRTPCPPGLRFWPRFKASTEAIIHHEVSIALHALVLGLMSLGAANKFAAYTFVLLWAMRLSAKFVVFFGAPNISVHFLPQHLRYLSTYFSKEKTSAFFPIAVVASTAAAAALAFAAQSFPLGSFGSIGFILMASLAWLAVIEHLALVLPLPDAALWRWAVPQPRSTTTNTP